MNIKEPNREIKQNVITDYSNTERAIARGQGAKTEVERKTREAQHKTKLEKQKQAVGTYQYHLERLVDDDYIEPSIWVEPLYKELPPKRQEPEQGNKGRPKSIKSKRSRKQLYKLINDEYFEHVAPGWLLKDRTAARRIRETRLLDVVEHIYSCTTEWETRRLARKLTAKGICSTVKVRKNKKNSSKGYIERQYVLYQPDYVFVKDRLGMDRRLYDYYIRAVSDIRGVDFEELGNGIFRVGIWILTWKKSESDWEPRSRRVMFFKASIVKELRNFRVR